MPDFLSMLRQNQTFPLGRPDTGDSGIGNAARQVIPLANSMKDRDMQRQKEMMQFQAAQARKAQLQAMQKPPQYLNPDTPTSGRTSMPAPVQGGFSPMQQFMQGREARDVAFKNQQTLQDSRLNSEFNGRLAETRLRSEGEMQRLAAEINARSQEGGLERQSREKIAGDALRARTGETAADHALRLRMNTDDNTAAMARTTEAGRQAAIAAQARPQGFDEQYNRQVQDFKINFPDYANRLTYDDTSKRWGIDLNGLTPEQQAIIKRRLTPGGSGAAPRPPSPSGNTGVRK